MIEETKSFETLALKWPLLAWVRNNQALVWTVLVCIGGWLVVAGNAWGGQGQRIENIEKKQAEFQQSMTAQVNRIEATVNGIRDHNSQNESLTALVSELQTQVHDLRNDWNDAHEIVNTFQIPKGRRTPHK